MRRRLPALDKKDVDGRDNPRIKSGDGHNEGGVVRPYPPA